MVETPHFYTGSAAILTAPCLICTEQKMWRGDSGFSNGWLNTGDEWGNISGAGKWKVWIHDWFFFSAHHGGRKWENRALWAVCERPRCCGESTRGECESLANFWSWIPKCVTHLMIVDAEKWFLPLLHQALNTRASALTSLTKILPSDSHTSEKGTVVRIFVGLQDSLRLDLCWRHLCFHGCFLLFAFSKICFGRLRETAVNWIWVASKFYAGLRWFALNSMKSFVD